MMQPLTLPLWLAGLYYYLFSQDGRTLRPLGLIYVLLFAIQNAKFYFLAPAYPMLFATGALSLERLIRRRSWNWLKPAYAAVLLVGGVALAPMVVPILPVETLANITARREAPGSSRSAAKKGSSRSTSPTGSAGRTWW
jgi:hypothetical protein